MKKLFFTALVAVVAVGGAFASNGKLIGYFNSSDSIIDCNTLAGPTCSQYPGGLFTQTSAENPERVAVDPTLLENVRYQQ